MGTGMRWPKIYVCWGYREKISNNSFVWNGWRHGIERGPSGGGAVLPSLGARRFKV